MLKKISPSSLIIIIVFIAILSYALIKKYNRERHPLFAWGISKGVSRGVKGNHILDYTFTVDGEEIKGFVPSSFCDKCPKCCIAGDSVIVRYEDGNAQNNDLIVKLPKDVTLQ
jgi:hypothetical protein